MACHSVTWNGVVISRVESCPITEPQDMCVSQGFINLSSPAGTIIVSTGEALGCLRCTLSNVLARYRKIDAKNLGTLQLIRYRI